MKRGETNAPALGPASIVPDRAVYRAMNGNYCCNFLIHLEGGTIFTLNNFLLNQLCKFLFPACLSAGISFGSEHFFSYFGYP